MKPPLPIYHLSCTLPLQHDHFDLLLPTFLMNPDSDLHLLLVASDLPDHEFGTLYLSNQTCSLILVQNFRSRLKTTSSLQLVINRPPIDLSVPLIQLHTRFFGRYKCYYITYIHAHILPVDTIHLWEIQHSSCCICTHSYERFHRLLCTILTKKAQQRTTCIPYQRINEINRLTKNINHNKNIQNTYIH